jgi:NAD-dependent dihydropyrimidine dehydrogenase PreA subunit
MGPSSPGKAVNIKPDPKGGGEVIQRIVDACPVDVYILRIIYY